MGLATSEHGSPETESAFAEHRPYLFALCYRMTGEVAAAEDLVQETFVRALAQPPVDRTRPWLPWLVRVATNLCIDALRRRQRQAYVGPWLPGALETPEGASLEPRGPASDPELRYAAAESLSYGFLVALELLTPMQRATLLLRDAFGYSGPQTAEMLGTSDENVRVTLHRARKRIAGAEPSAVAAAQQRAPACTALIMRMLAAAGAGDEAGLLACFAEDVELRSDGGGHYLAALRPVRGPDRVARFILGVGHKGEVVAAELRVLNGEPMLVVVSRPKAPRAGPRIVMRIAMDDDGRATAVHLLVSPQKLHGVAFPRDASSTPSVSR